MTHTIVRTVTSATAKIAAPAKKTWRTSGVKQIWI